MRLRGELRTLRDSLWFGLYTDSENVLGGHLHTTVWYANQRSGLYLSLIRMAGGTETSYDLEVQRHGVSGGGADARLRETVDVLAGKDLYLTLSKRGRGYRASLQIDGEVDDNNDPIIYETDPLTSLRSPGAPAIAVGQWEAASGETLIYVDSVTIETVD